MLITYFSYLLSHLSINYSAYLLKVPIFIIQTILNEMETLARQIKKDNALCISDAQKLRFEFDSAIKKIRVRNFIVSSC